MTKNEKRISIIVAVLALCPACIISSQGPQQVKYPDPHRFDNDIESFQRWDCKNACPKDAILFVGSSSIRGWKTAESFPDLPIINRGFGGSYAADALFFVNETVIKYKPKVIVIYEGDNDIEGSVPPNLAHKDFVNLTDKIHSSLPESQIICLSVKLCSSRWHLRKRIIELNKFNKQHSERKDYLTFVDITTVLLGPDGIPIDELFYSDKLHLNNKGYAKWSALLSPFIAERYAIVMKNKP